MNPFAKRYSKRFWAIQRAFPLYLLLLHIPGCWSPIYRETDWKHTVASDIEIGPISGIIDGPPEIVGTDLIMTIGYCDTATLNLNTYNCSAKIYQKTLLVDFISGANWKSPSDALLHIIGIPIGYALGLVVHSVRNTFLIPFDQNLHYRYGLLGFAISYLAPIEVLGNENRLCCCETHAVNAWASGTNYLAITIDGTPLIPWSEQSIPQAAETLPSSLRDIHRAMPRVGETVLDSNTWRNWYVSNSINRENILRRPFHELDNFTPNMNLTNKDPLCHVSTDSFGLEVTTTAATDRRSAILARENEPIKFRQGTLRISGAGHTEEITIDTAQVVKISLIPFVLHHIETAQADQDLALNCFLGWDLPLTIPHNQVVRILAEHWITEGL